MLKNLLCNLTLLVYPALKTILLNYFNVFINSGDFIISLRRSFLQVFYVIKYKLYVLHY